MENQKDSMVDVIKNRFDKTYLLCSRHILLKTFVFLSFILISYWPIHATETIKKDSIGSNIPADSIFVLKADNAYSTFNGPLQFSSFIQVKVHGLNHLQKLASLKNKPIILYLDGIPMKGITTMGGDKKNDVLFFVLHRDSASMMNWNLLRKIIAKQQKRELAVSVGFAGEQAYPTKFVMAAELSRAGDYFLAILAGTFFIIMFTFLVKRSNVLIDGKNSISGKYSLAKIIMAAWIMLVLFYLVYILSTTNSLPHLPDTILLIIAFSVITIFGTKIYQFFVPFSEQSPHTFEGMSKGFLIDMLSKDKGINLFKLQLLSFNLFTMVYITKEVISEMILPSFEPRYIVLIGCSHLIYLGSLFFEKNT